MGNDVQLHESVVERAPGEERRASPRHAASALGTVSARIIGGSPVALVNFSARGVLFECDSRLLIGARASVRITTTDANLIVTGRVVRSRVKGLVNGALRYDAALALDSELALQAALPPAPPEIAVEEPPPVPEAADDAPVEVAFESDDVAFESEPGIDGVFDPAPVEAYLAESDAALAEVARAVEPPPVPVVAEPETQAETIAPEPMHVTVTVGLEPVEAVSVELEPEPVALATGAPEPDAVADESIAFEADGGEVAFEASSDFEFEAMPADAAFEPEAVAPAEPVALASEPSAPSIDGPAYETAAEAESDAGSSMFDATYQPPVDETPVDSESMFHVTPPMPVHVSAASSMFDSRPSEIYGDAARADVVALDAVESGDVVSTIEDTVAPVDEIGIEATAETEVQAIDFEPEVAFEAEDAVMFESAFEADGAAPATVDYAAEPESIEPESIAPEPIAPEAIEVRESAEDAVDDMAAAEASEPIEMIEATEPVDESLETLPDLPLPAAAADDRALLQFSASVPHDLAELRRIAADNQW